MPQYEDFFLIIQGAEGGYTIEGRGPGEVSVPPLPLGFAFTEELKNEIELIAQGYAPTRERMQEVGSALYDALFPRALARAFGRAYEALTEGMHMRIKLAVRPPELNRIPWEMLFNPDDEFFLGARLTYPLVRYVESETPVASLLAAQTLRVLYVQAQPSGMAALNLEASENALRQGLGDQAEVKTLRNCTPEMLREQLRQPFHILHYDGHAYFDAEQQMGSLCLEDVNGESHHLSGEMLATYLDGTSVRLVVLAACESGMDSPTKRFSGVAQQIMKSSNLPAAVAMQFAVVDASAIAFNKGFYSALAGRLPVEAAVVEGRKSILETVGGDPFAAPDWATPVLFMRTRDGNVLPPADSTVMGMRAGAGLQALSDLVQISPEIRRAAGNFRTIFETATAEVDVLGDYKDLHDLLHQTQFHCYEPITAEQSRFPDDLSLDNLDSYRHNLGGIIDRLNDVAARKRVPETETAWFNDMTQAQAELQRALDDKDEKALKAAIRRLRKIISTQPVRINKGLVDSVRDLRLPILLEAMTSIRNQLAALQLDETKTAQFQQGLSSLERLADELNQLLNEHDRWQMVDGEIRRIDSLTENDFEELEMSWEDLKTLSKPLFETIDADWARNTLEASKKLDEALASGNPRNIRMGFKGFRREANSRFDKVDISLKTLCGGLRQIGEPLNAILRSFT
jgi:hypothetical protein